MRLSSGSFLVDELKVNLRRDGSIGGLTSSLILRVVLRTRTCSESGVLKRAAGQTHPAARRTRQRAFDDQIALAERGTGDEQVDARVGDAAVAAVERDLLAHDRRQ